MKSPKKVRAQKSPTTATVTTLKAALPPVGTITAHPQTGVACLVVGHTSAGIVVEVSNGRTHTLPPNETPALPKPGSAMYRASQLLTRDRSWIRGGGK